MDTTVTNVPSAPTVIGGLQLLRAQFADHQVGRLPKGTKAQNECPPDQKRNCGICGGWHHPAIKHLDYVGHAAVTDRLLDVDPCWQWEPLALDEKGLPLLDAGGGMWIRLTVCGVTRFGYGDAQGKTGPDATKEKIGDAIRNAAMRFGVAIDLWHKGELHLSPDEDAAPKPSPWTAELLSAAGAAAEAGTKAYGVWWKAQPAEVRSVLIQTPDHASYKAVADKADHAAADQAAAVAA